MELKEVCWEKKVKEAVWKKGRINPDYSPDVLRWDEYGKIMMWSKFGRTDSIFGWSIKAYDSTKDGDLNNLDNLYPVNSFTPDKDKQNLESPSTGG